MARAAKRNSQVRKSAPKAGPKARRHKSEQERIQDAVTKNSRPLKRAVRKSGRVNEFRYKPKVDTTKGRNADRLHKTWLPPMGKHTPQDGDLIVRHNYRSGQWEVVEVGGKVLDTAKTERAARERRDYLELPHKGML